MKLENWKSAETEDIKKSSEKVKNETSEELNGLRLSVEKRDVQPDLLEKQKQNLDDYLSRSENANKVLEKLDSISQNSDINIPNAPLEDAKNFLAQLESEMEKNGFWNLRNDTFPGEELFR
ncbi:hypothetical protein K9L27_01985 [Candidatus Gracilibacteria bacterium]|nr:hypothetical protein [Candidatus Gracilibacteria bacterium]